MALMVQTVLAKKEVGWVLDFPVEQVDTAEVTEEVKVVVATVEVMEEMVGVL